jgi:hypothetical protein
MAPRICLFSHGKKSLVQVFPFGIFTPLKHSFVSLQTIHTRTLFMGLRYPSSRGYCWLHTFSLVLRGPNRRIYVYLSFDFWSLSLTKWPCVRVEDGHVAKDSKVPIVTFFTEAPSYSYITTSLGISFQVATLPDVVGKPLSHIYSFTLELPSSSSPHTVFHRTVREHPDPPTSPVWTISAVSRLLVLEVRTDDGLSDRSLPNTRSMFSAMCFYPTSPCSPSLPSHPTHS